MRDYIVSCLCHSRTHNKDTFSVMSTAKALVILATATDVAFCSVQGVCVQLRGARIKIVEISAKFAGRKCRVLRE
jgi:hypothetical protein